MSEDQSNNLPLDYKESKWKNKPQSSNHLSHHGHGIKENISNTYINQKQQIGISGNDVHAKAGKKQEMMTIESSRFQKVPYEKPVDTGSDEFSSIISTPDEISGNLSGKDLSKSRRDIEVHGSQRRMISDRTEIINQTESRSRNIESKPASKINTSKKDDPETPSTEEMKKKNAGVNSCTKLEKENEQVHVTQRNTSGRRQIPSKTSVAKPIVVTVNQPGETMRKIKTDGIENTSPKTHDNNNTIKKSSTKSQKGHGEVLDTEKSISTRRQCSSKISVAQPITVTVNPPASSMKKMTTDGPETANSEKVKKKNTGTSNVSDNNCAN